MGANSKIGTFKSLFSLTCIAFSLQISLAEDSADISQINASLYSGAVNVVGKWQTNKEAIKRAYHGTDPSQFGSFFLLEPGTQNLAKAVDGSVPPPARPMHYTVGNYNANLPLIGYRILPVANRLVDETTYEPSVYYPNILKSADDTEVVGALALDSQLAKTYYGKSYSDLKLTRKVGQKEVEKTVTELFTEAAKKKDEKNIELQKAVDEKYPVVGILSYYHPQYFSGSIQEMAGEGRYETQGGFGHMGAYLGQGRERDAPENLYSSRGGLGVKGEPANLYSIRLKKNATQNRNFIEYEDTKLVNTNALATLKLLNKGVSFAQDYTRDVMKNVTLRSVFAFWRGWIDESYVFEDALKGEEIELWKKIQAAGNVQFKRIPDSLPRGISKEKAQELTLYYKIQSEPEWFLYCAEFVTLGYNITMNLLHNEESYVAAYGGNGEGESVFKLYQTVYKDRLDENAPLTPTRAYKALYESESALMAQSGPIMDRAEAKKEGVALVWAPQKTVDILAAFVSTYLPWTRYGAGTAAFMSLGFAPQAMSRMGIKFDDFEGAVLPLIATVIAHEIGKNTEALANPTKETPVTPQQEQIWKATVEGYVTGIAQQIYTLADNTKPQSEDEASAKLYVPKSRWMQTMEKLQNILLGTSQGVAKKLSYLQQAQRVARVLKHQNAQKADPSYVAQRFLAKEIREGLEEARAVSVTATLNVGRDARNEDEEDIYRELPIESYSPPAISQRIVHGLHSSNRRIEIVAEGTVLDVSEVEQNTGTDKTPEGEILNILKVKTTFAH